MPFPSSCKKRENGKASRSSMVACVSFATGSIAPPFTIRLHRKEKQGEASIDGYVYDRKHKNSLASFHVAIQKSMHRFVWFGSRFLRNRIVRRNKRAQVSPFFFYVRKMRMVSIPSRALDSSHRFPRPSFSNSLSNRNDHGFEPESVPFERERCRERRTKIVGEERRGQMSCDPTGSTCQVKGYE